MKPSLFLSHTSSDKPFARRLATDLGLGGARIWLDEAEMKIGDSLVAKIGTALAEMNYVGVVLSPDAVKSKWVAKELEIAINREFATESVVVLPFLYRDCNMPPFLTGRLYADFRTEGKYLDGLNKVKDRLGLPLSAGTIPDLEGYAADIRHQTQTVLQAAAYDIQGAEAALSADNKEQLSQLLQRAAGVIARGQLFNRQVALLRAFQTGTYSVRRTAVPLAKWIKGVLAVIRKWAPSDRRLTLRAENTDAAIDDALLEIAVYNLLDNAFKYSYVSTTIDVEVTSSARMAAIAVISRGVKVDRDDRERIFDPGFQSQSARAISGVGTGSGLYLARLIAEAHGGTLTFDRGRIEDESIFTITLPTL